MATDIQLSHIASTINNGSSIASCMPTGRYSKNTDRAKHNPTILDIESKYDDRFDDVNYYMGGGAADAGYYVGDILGV